MNVIVKGGLLIGILCAVWMYVVGFTGWYKDPPMVAMFYLVILIEFGVLVWGLRQTAAQGRTYGGQVGAGTMMAVIGGVIIIVASFLFTTVAFPNYFEELRAMQTEMFRAEGKSDAEINAMLDMAAPMQTPTMNALMGFVYTVVTGLVGSLIIGAFFRKK